MSLTRSVTQPIQSNANSYTYIHNNRDINSLAHTRITTKKDIQINSTTGDATCLTDSTIKICNWLNAQDDNNNQESLADRFLAAFHLDYIDSKLIDIINLHFSSTGSNERMLFIPIDRYMELRGLKDRKTAKRDLKQRLQKLEMIRKQLYKNLRGKEQECYFAALFNFKGLMYNAYGDFCFCVELSIEFFEMLKISPLMQFDKDLLKQNPNTYYIGRYLLELCRINAKKDKNKVSVLKILENTPSIPSYEDIKNTSRRYKKQIIEPFINALDECNNLLWDIVTKDDTPLTNEKIQGLTWNKFKSLSIRFSFLDYQDETQVIKSRKKYAEVKKKQALK